MDYLFTLCLTQVETADFNNRYASEGLLMDMLCNITHYMADWSLLSFPYTFICLQL